MGQKRYIGFFVRIPLEKRIIFDFGAPLRSGVFV